MVCYTKSKKSFMSKSIASGIPIDQQGIPFTAASATIRETHRAKKAKEFTTSKKGVPIRARLRLPAAAHCAKNLHICRKVEYYSSEWAL